MKISRAVRFRFLLIPFVWVIMHPMPVVPHSYGPVQLVASESPERPSQQQKQDPILRMTEQEKEALDKFVKHESRFKDHYQSHYSTSEYEYHQYRPAYQHGFELALDPRYRTMDWNSVEPEARRTWHESTMGLYNQYKDAVRYGWEQGVALERR
jgi:hypothetical protein